MYFAFALVLANTVVLLIDLSGPSDVDDDDDRYWARNNIIECRNESVDEMYRSKIRKFRVCLQFRFGIFLATIQSYV